MSRSSSPRKLPVTTPRPADPDLVTDQALAAFNTWSFKREQPSDPPLLRSFVRRAVQAQLPIPFVLYWGKGPRARIGRPDHDCLGYLGSMARRIATAYPPGVRMDLIFTDTHARLNGHAEHAISQYAADIEAAAGHRQFDCHRLSTLVRGRRGSRTRRAMPDLATLERLETCAAKWFHGEGSTGDGARRYFAMNMIEREVIEDRFPSAIFITFNGSDYRSLFPETLPIFYMYSLRKGVAVKPWFLPDETACDDSATGTAA